MSDRVGVLGGSFDPPHRAHIAMALAARERLGLNRVLFMPAPQPPHKSNVKLTAYTLRRRMTELAIIGEDALLLSTFEENREGPSFTANMLDDYVGRFGHEVYFLIGADSAADFATWREPERILQLATLVVFPRRGYSRTIKVGGTASIVLFEAPMIDVSSTELRARAARGEPLAGDVAPAVEQFILDNSVYC